MKTNKCKCGNNKRKGYSQCRKCYLNYYKNRTSKICAGCNKDLPLDDFRKRLDGKRPRSRCKKCESKDYQKYRKSNIEKVNIAKRKWYKKNPDIVKKMMIKSFCKKVGLDSNEVFDYIKNHNGCCEICGKPPKQFKHLSIDHDHKTNKFRGLLCYTCNFAIGQFEDNVDLLDKAKNYLQTKSLGALRSDAKFQT